MYQVARFVQCRDAAVTVSSGDMEGAGAIGRDLNRDRMREVDELAFPVVLAPSPRKTRPGASAATLAIECAVTGAIRVRDQDAGTDGHARGIDCGQCQHGVAVRPDHLRVGHPGVVNAAVFGHLDQLLVADAGVDRGAEFYAGVCPGSR